MMTIRAAATMMVILAGPAACTGREPAPPATAVEAVKAPAAPAEAVAVAAVVAPIAAPMAPVAAPVAPAADPAADPVAAPAPPADPLAAIDPGAPGPNATPLSLSFSPVIEGECPDLGVSLVDGAAFIHATPEHFVARLLPDGTTEPLPVDAKTLRDPPNWVTIGHIEAVEGAWPDDLWLRYMQVDGRLWEGSRYLKRKDGGWWPIATQDEEEKRNYGVERMYEWTGGNWLGRMNCRDWGTNCKDLGLMLQVIRGPGKAPKFPELVSKVEGCWSRYEMTVLPDGGIVAFGRFCHELDQANEGGAYYAVRWSEADGTKIDALPLREPEARAREPGSVVAMSAVRIYASVLADNRDEFFTVFAFDGSTWTTLPPLAGEFAAMDIDRDGSLWVVAGGALSRIGAAGVWERQEFPTAAVKRLGGLREPIAWVTQADGALWLRQEGQTFTRIELPPPVYSATGKYAAESVTSADRDVWVTATYEEKEPGRKKSQTRRALLRNGPSHEPLRCTEVTTNGPTRGTHTWPPAARDDCATPYAILLRASAWTPKKFPYTALGKALKGQQAFATAKFSEIEIGGQKLVGAAVPTVAEARALVEHVARKMPRSQPELVCATPTELRPLPFDLATGALVP